MEKYRFENIAVLGAAGKMGRGIVMLNLIHSAQQQCLPENRDKQFAIQAIDSSPQQLDSLLPYLKNQLWRWCGKNTALIRQILSADPTEDETELITRYVNGAISLIHPSTRVEMSYNSHLIFEAVTEEIGAKTTLLKQINLNNRNKPYFLTNTSSIPIKEIDRLASLDGNIIGCHFYNPPVVQKLVEVISLENGNPEITELVHYFCAQLNKTVVPSNDMAGFIGNGFFMREIVHALEWHTRLCQQYPFAQSIHLIDTLTREMMVRPMGIFQLMDYVGIDVCHFIIQVMNQHWDEPLSASLLKQLLDCHIRGGQNPDGSQRDGIFKYDEGRIVAVVDQDMTGHTDVGLLWPTTTELLGATPNDNHWKETSKTGDWQQHLEHHFEAISRRQNQGDKWTMDYMQAMKMIAQKLCDQNVANNVNDVNTVMKTGFHHLYGPWNHYT